MSVGLVKYDIANGSARVAITDNETPSCSSSSSSKEQVYMSQLSRQSYDGEVSSGSTAGSFTVTNLTRTLDIKFESVNYTVTRGILRRGNDQCKFNKWSILISLQQRRTLQ